MLQIIAHAIETVLLLTGVLMLVRCAFQYASRTHNWHRVNVVLFHIRSLSKDEMKWWYAAMLSLSVGAGAKLVSLALYQ
ncbi:hypothetical protein AT251_22205 [Enterovibrio nigricans]|uniref:Uncharacterized protein n=1 Tax=Enterovibrio nigricans DSM 22720 TaxID=1121868 RepID=A0A1T4VRY0_9GAMM|nr:hypothetical protein [Enterovibrio nigricans]PKF48982.1 hypothetical protein AT251_22205 [Enterovibrio nigricans]SKA67733.1 hypothetical protein SAMN02745132_04228 [Enterovibrio nigricans DSM 22720]